MTIPDGLPVLSYGAHDRPQNGACVMEYVSILAGLPFGDQPGCTEPALATYARNFNDSLPEEHRYKLLPLIPKLIDSADSDHELDEFLNDLAGPDGRMESWYLRIRDQLYGWLDQRWVMHTSYRAPWVVCLDVTPKTRSIIDRETTQWVAEFTAFVDEWNAAIGRTPEPLTSAQTAVLAAAVG